MMLKPVRNVQNKWPETSPTLAVRSLGSTSTVMPVAPASMLFITSSCTACSKLWLTWEAARLITASWSCLTIMLLCCLRLQLGVFWDAKHCRSDL